MRIIIALAFFNLFMACNRYCCTGDISKNRGLFQSHLNNIINYEEGRQSILVDKYREAIDYLSSVTGIESRAGYSSTMGYINKKEYKEDIKNWKNWYKKNKCKLTDTFVDSVSNQYTNKSTISK
ncbi:MAG: hypothetical protein QM731_09895 [Chitinophagaceae bacterium]